VRAHCALKEPSRLDLRFIDCPQVALCYDEPSQETVVNSEATMKNPLDSLGQTVLLGFVLTVVVHLLIRAIA